MQAGDSSLCASCPGSARPHKPLTGCSGRFKMDVHQKFFFGLRPPPSGRADPHDPYPSVAEPVGGWGDCGLKHQVLPFPGVHHEKSRSPWSGLPAFSLFLLRAHAGNTAPSLPSGQRRGQATSPEQKFFRGWGRGGRGSFYQKTPLPPQLSQTPSSPPDTQPRSQWPGWTSRHVPSLSSSGQGRISLRCSNRGSGTGMAESRARV